MTKYLQYIPLANRQKPKFSSTIKLITTPPEKLQQTFKIQDFDIDMANGKQLDIIGEWVGISRFITIPLLIYFSFDDVNLGFDKGFWQGEYDSNKELKELDDESYRILLKAKIAINHWDGTNETLPEIYRRVFDNTDTNVFHVDNFDMSMSIYYVGKILNPILKSIIKNDYLNIKPAGVRIKHLTISLDNTSLFGFDIENKYITGFDSGSWQIDLEE